VRLKVKSMALHDLRAFGMWKEELRRQRRKWSRFLAFWEWTSLSIPEARNNLSRWLSKHLLLRLRWRCQRRTTRRTSVKTWNRCFKTDKNREIYHRAEPWSQS